MREEAIQGKTAYDGECVRTGKCVGNESSEAARPPCLLRCKLENGSGIARVVGTKQARVAAQVRPERPSPAHALRHAVGDTSAVGRPGTPQAYTKRVIIAQVAIAGVRTARGVARGTLHTCVEEDGVLRLGSASAPGR